MATLEPGFNADGSLREVSIVHADLATAPEWSVTDTDEQARTQSLEVGCPRCRSGVGIRCFDGIAPKEYPHTIRVTTAQKGR